MHWHTGVICLIIVMVVMYVFVRGACGSEPDWIDPPGIEPFWRCKRCGKTKAVVATDNSLGCDAFVCPNAAQSPGVACPMELIGEDGKAIADERYDGFES